MGVVYKGRDTHLDRFVALKVLPHDRIGTDDAERRFIQEAKSASSLNHPNIVTVYDIALQDGVMFIAMELVSGKTLAEVVPRQGLPLGRALSLAVQIADGLAAAHKAGLVHRDLKPGNIMVSDEGRVKILDFGLAKLIDRGIEGSDAATQSIPDATGGRSIVGTVGYMSPEQAEGAAIDSRSDIFSFGVVLYEMVTGRKPFTGESPMKVLSAILKDTPRAVSEIAPGAPRDLERIIDRCLRKDPERRWQHIQDVRIALLELKEESDSGKLTIPVQRSPAGPSRRWWLGAAGAAALLAVVAGWQMTRSEEPTSAADLVPVPLTTYRGDERDPAFSPDGTQVAFSWGPEGGVSNTYVKLVGAGDPIRLTNSPYAERMSQWSPDGKWIAFGRRNVAPPNTDFVVMPALGGAEKVVARTPSPYCAWTPDSQWLIVPDGSPAGLYLFQMHGGEKKLIVPPLQDRHPVVGGVISPDGRSLAVIFMVGGRRPLYIVPLGSGYAPAGEPRAITPADWDVASWAWMPDSKEIILISVITGSNLGGITAMYRVAADGGTPRRMDFAGDNPWFLDVARRGDRLAYTRLQRDVNVYAAELAPDGTLTSPGQSVASSSRRDISPVYSPDGARIAVSSDRDGSSEIWLTASDGRNAVQLTSQGRAGVFDSADFPAWSPDGAQIVYAARALGRGAPDLFIVPASGGAPRRLTDDPGNEIGASWSRDGRTIYFLSNRGGGATIWSMPASGGAARQLSKSPSSVPPPIESPDGQWVYFRTPGAISRVRPSGADETVIVRDRVASAFSPTTRGLFYLAPAADLQSSVLRLVPLAGGPARDLGTIPFPVISGLSFTPDFTRMLYARCDQCAADIMLVENFR
jgi:serine/threonine protein kinase/WD40 repeat protein